MAEFKESHIPRLRPPNPIERFVLTLKNFLSIASGKDKERLDL
jgi:hypothetical protein